MGRIIIRDDFTCYLCGQLADPDDIHIDHVLPVSRGGPHLYSNLRVTHGFCNDSKGAKTPEEWWERQKMPIPLWWMEEQILLANAEPANEAGVA